MISQRILMAIGASVMIVVLLTGCSQQPGYGNAQQTVNGQTGSTPSGGNPDLTSDEFPQIYSDMEALNGTDSAAAG